MLAVGLREEFADLLDGCGLAEEAAEGVLAEVFEDDLHGLEVFLGPVLRAQQQDNRVDGLTVEGVEVDAPGGEADRSGHLRYELVLDVGDSDALAKAGGAAAFAVEDAGDEFVADGEGCCTAADEGIQQLRDGGVAFGGDEWDRDGGGVDDRCQAKDGHGFLPGGSRVTARGRSISP